jgi:outer membrane protein assembly factor BamB
VIAFDTQGAILWQADFPRGSFGYPLHLFASGDTVLSRSNDRLRAYNATDGAELWTKAFDNLDSTDTFDTSNGHFIGMNTAPRWRQWLFAFGFQPGA